MKRSTLIALVFLSVILLLVVTVFAQRVYPEQKKPAIIAHSFPDTLANVTYNLDSLKDLIGNNKILPEGFETAAAIALSAYPELKDIRIEMILTKDGAPMEATVNIWSLFGSRKNRRYCVLLNNAQQSHFNPILLRSLPFDAQVGILAHELGHIVYYHDLNIFQFAKWGLKYLRNDEFRAVHERTTDLMAVYHGLGNQIYQYAYFVRHDPSCRDFYAQAKDFMDQYYMTDKELWKVINE